MQYLKVQIDVTKIDKKRLYKGKKGTYLNGLIVLRDEKDKFGNDGFISESVSKEEREAGVKGTILGNVSYIFKEGKPKSKPEPEPEPDLSEDDDLPF